MTRRRMLVLTTVHHADDARIREKLIRTLEDEWRITYATRLPPPSDRSGLVWVPLLGGRLRRNLSAARRLMFGFHDVAVLHDPETIVAGRLASTLRRSVVVFDVHENIPAQVRTKEWVPLRRLVAWLSGRVLLWAERSMPIILAETGYGDLFRRPHPSFPNYPLLAGLPTVKALPPASALDIVVYVGDVTRQRGALTALEATAAARPSGGLVVVGPCSDDLAAEMRERAALLGVQLTMTGRLPHREAMQQVASARLGLAPLADIPNYHDSLPTKVLEYLAMGVPVVASDLPGTRRVVGDRPGIRLVQPGDQAAWNATVSSALADPALREAARAGAGAVRATFGWPAEEVRAFFRSL